MTIEPGQVWLLDGSPEYGAWKGRARRLRRVLRVSDGRVIYSTFSDSYSCRERTFKTWARNARELQRADQP